MKDPKFFYKNTRNIIPTTIKLVNNDVKIKIIALAIFKLTTSSYQLTILH